MLLMSLWNFYLDPDTVNGLNKHLDEIWYGRYAIGVYPKILLF
jgi:hypothetical protein